jgi:hypothetical protein
MTLSRWLQAQWDRALAGVLIVASIIMVFVGWYRLSNTSYVYEQLSFLVSGAIGGLLLMAIGGILWLTADLRDEWRKLDRIEQALLAGARPARDGDQMSWQAAEQSAEQPAPQSGELDSHPTPAGRHS